MAADEGGGSGLQKVFFQGSISEAIGKAKIENKQVVVYVGSENAESKEMEAVTWPAVADSLKGMLILRLQEGSPDAASFGAFCKIDRAPTVAVIGTAGDCVFWHEGFISSADLVKGVEEGVLKAQLARAMAAMLTNAGATAPRPAQDEERRHDEQQRSALRAQQGRGDMAGGVQGPFPPVRAPMPAQSEERQVEGARPSVGAQAGGRAGQDRGQEEEAEMQYGWTVTFTHRERIDNPGLDTVDADSEADGSLPDLLDEFGSPVLENPSRGSGTAPEQPTAGGSSGPGETAATRASTGGGLQDKKEQKMGASASKDLKQGEAESTVKKQKRDEKPPPPGPSKPPALSPTQAPPAAPQSLTKPAAAVPSTASAQPRKAVTKESPKPAASPVSTSQTAVIQFRLTNGDSMRAEFDKNAPLWDARAWLDANRNENGSPYDLAIPFPKRILTESDLDKSFVELQLFPRASLLLIPKRFSTVGARPAPSGANSEQPGVVAGVTRTVGGVLGYLNPLAYLWGPAAPPAEAAAQPAGQQPWEYGPNPQLERAVREGVPGPSAAQEAPSRGLGSGGRFATPNSNHTGSSDQTRKRGAGARGNIHGLNRSSEEEADPRRNNFWNGNSTQFGSDDKDQ